MHQSFENRMSVSVAGSHIHVLRAGTGPAVVLAHSYLWDAQMWQPQIAALCAHYDVIVPELWGHGASGPMPPETRSIGQLAEQHLELFDAMGLKQVTIVGLSVGAMWAAELALIAPHRVKALVLMDSYLGPEPEARRQQYWQMLNAVERLGAVPPPMVDALVPMFLSDATRRAHPHIEAEFRQQLTHWDTARLRDSIVPLGRQIFGRRDALADLPRLSMPALIMSGSADVSRPPSEARQMAMLMDAPFIEIPEAGHIASIERPEFVTRQLLDFLAEHTGPQLVGAVR